MKKFYRVGNCKYITEEGEFELSQDNTGYLGFDEKKAREELIKQLMSFDNMSKKEQKLRRVYAESSFVPASIHNNCQALSYIYEEIGGFDEDEEMMDEVKVKTAPQKKVIESLKKESLLLELSTEYGIPFIGVCVLADMLGPSEDYDGLIAALEDFRKNWRKEKKGENP